MIERRPNRIEKEESELPPKIMKTRTGTTDRLLHLAWRALGVAGVAALVCLPAVALAEAEGLPAHAAAALRRVR